MFNPNLGTFLFQQPILYPYGYQFILIPQPMNTQYTQIFPIQQHITPPQVEILPAADPQTNREKQTISETESKIESDSNDIEIKTPIHKTTNQTIGVRKSQKPNFLAKSTNIQKNYAKAIVSYACRQRNMVIQILGEHRGYDFLKLMNKLRNKLRNISHITRYTHQTDFLSLFRILGYEIQITCQEQLFEEGVYELHIQFKNSIKKLSYSQQNYSQAFASKILRIFISSQIYNYQDTQNLQIRQKVMEVQEKVFNIFGDVTEIKKIIISIQLYQFGYVIRLI